MSPEQCFGKPLRLKSDIWQIGCVLYYLITTKHPFVAKVSKKVIRGTSGDIEILVDLTKFNTNIFRV